MALYDRPESETLFAVSTQVPVNISSQVERAISAAKMFTTSVCSRLSDHCIYLLCFLPLFVPSICMIGQISVAYFSEIALGLAT